MKRLILLALAATMYCAQEPTFRTEVNLVGTTVLVRSTDGALIADLRKDDFEVLEDGVPQRVQFFAREGQLPLSLALVVDVSGSQDKFLKQHNRDVEKFLTAVLGPTDRAVAVCFGNHLRLVSDMTGSVDQIMDGLRRFDKGERRFPEIGPKEERDLGTALYDAVYFVTAEKLKQVEGRRKAVLVFSDGEENSSEHDLLDAVEEAQSEDAIIYCIRYTDSERWKISVPLRRKHHHTPIDLNADRAGLTARNKYGIRAMKHLSSLTGGAAYDAMESDLSGVFAQIGNELRSLYSVGFISSNPKHDGSFRKLTIRCKRENAAVRAKSGYYAR